MARPKKSIPIRVKEVTQGLYSQLEGDEKALVDAMLGVVNEYGKFGSPTSNVYINYTPAAENEDQAIGVKCGNCVFHAMTEDGIECSAIDAEIEEGGLCRLSMIPPGLVNEPTGVMEAEAGSLKTGDYVSWNSSGGRSQGQITRIATSGSIDVPDSTFTIDATEDNPAALITVWERSGNGWRATGTRVGHRFSTLTKISALKKAESLREAETYKIPAGVQSAAKRAVAWISDGKAGGGFTDTGRRRASQLASGGSVSRDVVARMKSYFARHAGDKNAEGFSAGEKGYPSPGRVAWDAWGGDAGKTWVSGIKLDS